MPVLADLTGQRFGDWLVLYRAENRGHSTMWHCRCSLCGTERDVYTTALKSGASTSCGCKQQNTTNVVGQTFGHLRVLSQEKNKCHCICEKCGTEVDYKVRDLIKGKHKSCGCLVHKDENLVGQKFGHLLVLEQYGHKQEYICKCDCGNEKICSAYKLRSGLAKSCGKCYNFKGEDLTGQKFGHWTVESFSHKTDDGRYYWNCVCDCAEHTRRKVQVKLLKRGVSKSCGCTQKVSHKHFEGQKIGKWTFIKPIDSLRWECECECGNRQIVYYSNIIRGLSKSCGCDDISHKGSTEENEIRDYILELNPNLQLEYHNREILDGREIDIYIPEYNLGIEYNGSVYHATINGLYGNKDKNYHKDKFILAKEKGVRLLTIFDVDWQGKQEKIKQLIKDLIIPCKKIYGRDCEIHWVSKEDALEFFNTYHLQDANKSFMKFNYGLYYNNELLSVMSFSNLRFGVPKLGYYELYRYCVKSGYTILGGAEKLFKHFIKSVDYENIICYSYNDYFDGSIYKRLGFNFDGYTTLSYYWYLGGKEFPRGSCQPKKLKELYPELYEKAEGSKEDYIMAKLGARKVYRCGNTKWIYSKEV